MNFTERKTADLRSKTSQCWKKTFSGPITMKSGMSSWRKVSWSLIPQVSLQLKVSPILKNGFYIWEKQQVSLKASCRLLSEKSQGFKRPANSSIYFAFSLLVNCSISGMRSYHIFPLKQSISDSHEYEKNAFVTTGPMHKKIHQLSLILYTISLTEPDGRKSKT